MKMLSLILGSLVLLANQLFSQDLLKPGDSAPNFSAKNQNEINFKLSDYQGKKNVILYFYPKDFSKGCTTEACSFRDNYESFQNKDTEVIGVSFDSQDSHKSFAATNKLPFSLVSDPADNLGKLYHVPKLIKISDRVTYLIDKAGKIRFVYHSLTDAGKHVSESLKALEELKDKGK